MTILGNRIIIAKQTKKVMEHYSKKALMVLLQAYKKLNGKSSASSMPDSQQL